MFCTQCQASCLFSRCFSPDQGGGPTVVYIPRANSPVWLKTEILQVLTVASAQLKNETPILNTLRALIAFRIQKYKYKYPQMIQRLIARAPDLLFLKHIHASGAKQTFLYQQVLNLEQTDRRTSERDNGPLVQKDGCECRLCALLW